MSLHSLPLEIVRDILEDCDCGTLLNLAQVNRSFNREAEIILYREVCFRRKSHKLLGFLNAVRNSQLRSNHVHTLDVFIYSSSHSKLLTLISSTLPSLSNLRELCFIFETIPPATWTLQNSPSSLVSLDVGLACGPRIWELLKPLHNLRHLAVALNEQVHICNFPSDIVHGLASFSGGLSCIPNVLSNRPVTSVGLKSTVDADLLNCFMKDLTLSKSEITVLKLFSITGLGSMFLSKVAEHCPLLEELVLGSSFEDRRRILDPENWGLIFREFKSLREITLVTIWAFPRENRASIITSWGEKCPHLSSIFLLSIDSQGWEELFYDREQLGLPGVLTTALRTVPSDNDDEVKEDDSYSDSDYGSDYESHSESQSSSESNYEPNSESGSNSGSNSNSLSHSNSASYSISGSDSGSNHPDERIDGILGHHYFSDSDH